MIKNRIFQLLFFVCFASYAYCEELTKDIVLTVGKTVRINPRTDFNLSTKQYTHVSYSGRVGESNGIDVVVQEEEIVLSGYIYQHYSYADLLPQLRGNYIIRFLGTKKQSASTSVPVEIFYNIKVVDVVSVSIPSTLSLTCGDSFTFTPVVIDSEAETTLTWSTSDASVVSVSDGTVTALKEGTAIITCISDNGISAQCEVTVGPRIVTDITLNYAEYELEQNQTLQLETTVLPADAPNQKVTWSSRIQMWQ